MNKPTFRPMNTIEILGASIAFNNAVSNQYGIDPTLEFFYCDESLQSTDAANGNPFYLEDELEDYPLSYLAMSVNNVLFAVAYDSKENEIFYKVEQDELFKITTPAYNADNNTISFKVEEK